MAEPARGTPAIAADGTIYAVTFNGTLYAVTGR
jgi:outer membrane protein assembly factor BamB